MLFAKTQDKLLDGSPHVLERHRWRNANIQEDIGAIRRPADTPGVAAAHATHIHSARLSVVGSFLFPRGDPGINRVENLLHSEDRAVALLPARKRRVHVVAAR